jgi:hypothetical protein
MKREIDMGDYQYVDVIMGEEKETAMPKPNGNFQFKTFPIQFQEELRRYCASGGNLFISGAYIASDLFEKNDADSNDIRFAQDVLKYKWRTNHAARRGGIIPVDDIFSNVLDGFQFNTEYNSEVYAAEAPDGIEAIHGISSTILRYSENNISAAVAYQGDYNAVIFGFPFETILEQQNRDKVMQAIFNYFRSNKIVE